MSYETYAAVRQWIRCEERGRISVKGIAYPVATYQVVDTYENLSAALELVPDPRSGQGPLDQPARLMGRSEGRAGEH